MAYPSRSTLVSASSVTALTGLSSAQQDALRAASISAIEAFCQQSFGTPAAAYAKYVDAQGGDTLFLPARLATLSSLVVAGTSGVTEDNVIVAEDRDRLTIDPFTGVGLTYYEQALRDINNEPASFTWGHDTIAITGVWGWPDVDFPSAIGTAIRLDMEDQALADTHQLSASIRALRRMGVTSMSQGGVNARYGDGESLSEQVCRLLDPYVWLTPGVAV